jgi:CubicO group peptidase (beta-lactamase class C family)
MTSSDLNDPVIDGSYEPGFKPVHDAFRNNFRHEDEIGAALAVYHRGELVVDLWGGLADPRDHTPWTQDTLAYVYSTTKGMTTSCANLLIQQGHLNPDAPVARYWPEFAQNGKKEIPVRWLLTHQAGLPRLDHPIPLTEALTWHPMVNALAAQVPIWQPGDGHGYHAHTFGWLVGELIRRTSGQTPGQFFQDHFAKPLDLEFWIGLPTRHQHRVARILEPVAIEPDTNPTAVTKPHFDPNDPRVHAAELPASNGIGTARSIARLYAALIDSDHPILTHDTLAAATTEYANGHDRTLDKHTRFGLGYGLPSRTFPFFGGNSFGHGGRGGSLGFADPDHHIAFGYIMNNMRPGLASDNRTTNITDALHHTLATL